MSNDKIGSLLFQTDNVLTLQTRLTNILCYILVILGVVGNMFGLFIFSSSRRSRRISSVYVCLATCSSITNLLCVIRYAPILHSVTRKILRELVKKAAWACKLYEFSFSFRIISSWITLFWMFERLMCVSRRLQSIFNRWNSFKLQILIPIFIIIVILTCSIGPPVYMFWPQIDNDIINSTIEITKIYCGLNPKASVKWKKYFYELHLGKNHYTVRCLFSELIPTGAIILFNTYIVHHLRRTYRRFHRRNKHISREQRPRMASWMNIVLILHSILFLSSLLSHITGHFMAIEAHETWWAALSILLNCSLNFYVYCLSGKAFRNEIRRFIQRFQIQS